MGPEVASSPPEGCSGRPWGQDTHSQLYSLLSVPSNAQSPCLPYFRWVSSKNDCGFLIYLLRHPSLSSMAAPCYNLPGPPSGIPPPFGSGRVIVFISDWISFPLSLQGVEQFLGSLFLNNRCQVTCGLYLQAGRGNTS